MMELVAVPYGDGKCTARVDFMNSSVVDDIDLDDEVTLIVRGKVKSLRGSEKRKSEDYPMEVNGKPRKPRERLMEIPGSIEIEVTDFKVEEAHEFDGRKMEDDD